MNEVSFREKIIALREEFLLDKSNTNRNSNFWFIMDSISDELVIKWAERAIKIKNPVHWKIIASEYNSVCNILHYQKNYDPMNEMPWSIAQKRKCIFYIITMWDDLEMSYFC